LGRLTPGRTAADHPAKGIEDNTEAVDTLASVLGKEAEIGPDELPLGVGGVTRVMLVSDHALQRLTLEPLTRRGKRGLARGPG
jgi:hypothetical protein